MMDHNALRDEISSAKRYRKLQELKVSINSLARKVPLSISAELEGRLTEKFRAFDYPMCNVTDVKVIFSNGLSKVLDRDECHYAMSRGMKLSDYIFSRYVSARDFELDSAEFSGSTNFGIFSDVAIKEKDEREFNSTGLKSELERKVDSLMDSISKIEKYHTVFAENIPKMARDINDLKERLDSLQKKLNEKR